MYSSYISLAPLSCKASCWKTTDGHLFISCSWDLREAPFATGERKTLKHQIRKMFLLLCSCFCSDSSYPGLDGPPVPPALVCPTAGRGKEQTARSRLSEVLMAFLLMPFCVHWYIRNLIRTLVEKATVEKTWRLHFKHLLGVLSNNIHAWGRGSTDLTAALVIKKEISGLRIAGNWRACF